jgi:hypothetical protein
MLVGVWLMFMCAGLGVAWFSLAIYVALHLFKALEGRS